MSETSGEMFRSTFSRGDCTMDVSLLSSTHGKEKWSFWLFTGPGVLSSSAYGGTYSATIAGTELLPEPNGTMGDLRLAAPTPLPLCSFEGSTLGRASVGPMQLPLSSGSVSLITTGSLIAVEELSLWHVLESAWGKPAAWLQMR